MKFKFVVLGVLALFAVACGGGTSSSTPSNNNLVATYDSDTSRLSWSTSNPEVTVVDVAYEDGTLITTGGPVGETYIAVESDVNVVVTSYDAQLMAVDIIILTLTRPPFPGEDADITISWSLPTTYDDGTTIPQSEIDLMVVEVYWDTSNHPFVGTEELIATSTPGSTQVTVTKRVRWDVTYYFSARCHVDPDGLWSAFTSPSPHTWASP